MIKRWLRSYLGINAIFGRFRDTQMSIAAIVDEMEPLADNVKLLQAQVMDLREKLNLDPMVPSDFDPTEYIGVGGDPQLGA